MRQRQTPRWRVMYYAHRTHFWYGHIEQLFNHAAGVYLLIVVYQCKRRVTACRWNTHNTRDSQKWFAPRLCAQTGALNINVLGRSSYGFERKLILDVSMRVWFLLSRCSQTNFHLAHTIIHQIFTCMRVSKLRCYTI